MKRTVALIILLGLALVPMYGGILTGGNVLVWGTGDGDGNVAGIASWIQASGRFASVTGVAADSMTLAQLLAYDQVLYFSNHSEGQDPVAIGDTLDAFAGTGRRLVLAVFSWADQGNNTLGGGIINNGTSPFLVNGGSLYSDATMLSNDASDFFAGVNTLGGYYRDNVKLSAGAVQRGTWSDGVALLATKGNVVAVNLFPDDSFGSITGDYQTLFINALSATGGAPEVPEPSTIVLGGAALIALGLVRFRKK